MGEIVTFFASKRIDLRHLIWHQARKRFRKLLPDGGSRGKGIRLRGRLILGYVRQTGFPTNKVVHQMVLKLSRERKGDGRTNVRTDVRTDGQTDNPKT